MKITEQEIDALKCPNCTRGQYPQEVGNGKVIWFDCRFCSAAGYLIPLTLIGYQEEAAKTAIYPTDKALEYLTLGLVGEAGEIANKVKKELRGDNSPAYEDYLKEVLRDELGDVLWYVSELAKHLGLTLEEVAQSNLNKLASRKERGVIKGDGDKR